MASQPQLLQRLLYYRQGLHSAQARSGPLVWPLEAKREPQVADTYALTVQSNTVCCVWGGPCYFA